MKINKAVLAGTAIVAAAGVLAAASFVFASTALTASCSAAVSGNVITWTATTTGGNAPFTVLWSGNTGIVGSTSSVVGATYGTNGTYSATVTATDASSTVATGTCSATVTSNVTVTPTSTLNVFVAVNNATSGTANASNFSVSVTGANATPGSFTGSASGTPVVVNGGAAYSVTASSLASYTMGTSGNCTGPIANGGTDSCTITETFVPAPPAPRVNPPMLNINPSGHFLGRGMTVTSVGTNSFQAQVWGITYTVNWSGSLNNSPEFWFRFKASTSTPAQQLTVGDEVGVSGTVSPSAPLIVNANVVRDYSITAPRPEFQGHEDNGQGNGGENNGKGNGNGTSNNNGGDHGNGNKDNQNRLNDLMKQLKGLQDLFNNRFGGNH